MPGKGGVIKNSTTHSVKPNRKRDNFEDFNKNEYDNELIKKEQQYSDCLLYIEKLEKELKRYQEMYPYEAIDNKGFASDYINDLPTHKESMGEYLELIIHHPLLQSYEQNVRSLERDLENRESNYNNLKADLEKMMEENEDLRIMLVKKTKELNKALEGNSSIPLPDETDRDRARRLGGTSEEMLNLIETMKNDQEALTDQIETLKIRNESLETNYTEKESRFNELQDAAQEANTQCFKIQEEFNKLKHMYDSLNSEFIIVQDKLEKESRDKDDLIAKEKKLESQISTLTRHNSHLKESYNELSDKKSSEVDSLSRELSDYDIREREMKGRIENLEKSNFAIEEENRLTKRDYNATKNDNLNMVQLLEQYEADLESYKKREAQLDALREECHEKIQEVKLKEDQFNLREQHYYSKIHKLEEEARSDSRDKEEKYNSLIESLKAKQRIVLEERETEIKELNTRYSESYSENEKNKIENDRLRTDIAKLDKALRDSNHEVDKKCDDYERKLKVANEDKDENIRRLESSTLSLKSEIDTLQFELKTKVQEIRELESKSNIYKGDYDKMAEDFRRSKENYRIMREEKENCELETNRVKQLYNTKMQDLQKRLDSQTEVDREKNDKFQCERNNYLKIIKNLEALNDKWKSEHSSTVDYFTRLVLSLNQENQAYKDQNLELKKDMKRKEISYGVDKPSRMGKSKSRDRVK